MKVFLAIILALTLNPTSSSVSLSALPLKKTKTSRIPERKLGGNVEAQMDAEDAGRSFILYT